jgi:hypothetical protein
MSYSISFYHEINLFAKRVKDMADAIRPCLEYEYHSRFFSHYRETVEALQEAFRTVDAGVMSHLSGNTKFTKVRLKELRDHPSTLKFLQAEKDAVGFKTDYFSVFGQREAEFNKIEEDR